jgi:hypothetical protein
VRAVPDTEAETKWKAVGDRALTVWRFDLARECFEKAGDLNALMLLLLSIGDKAGLRQLATKAGSSSSFILAEYSDPHLYEQRKRVRITLHLQVYSSLGTLRHVSTSSQKRSVRQRQRFLHERMLQGTCSFL